MHLCGLYFKFVERRVIISFKCLGSVCLSLSHILKLEKSLEEARSTGKDRQLNKVFTLCIFQHNRISHKTF